jgi:hypothetical protein
VSAESSDIGGRNAALPFAESINHSSLSTSLMTTRPVNSGTALRRLMTEYKQLTAGGESHCYHSFDLGLWLAGSPDGMFTAGSSRQFSY